MTQRFCRFAWLSDAAAAVPCSGLVITVDEPSDIAALAAGVVSMPKRGSEDAKPSRRGSRPCFQSRMALPQRARWHRGRKGHRRYGKTLPVAHAVPEALARFVVEIPRALINALIHIHQDLGFHERND